MEPTSCTDEQILDILNEHKDGAKCALLRRKHGMSEGSFSNLKGRFGNMTVAVAKRLKTLEVENAKLKELLTEQMLDLVAMKERVSKCGDICRDARAGAPLKTLLGLPERQAFRSAGAKRKMIRYQSQRAPDTVLRWRLREPVNDQPRSGYQCLRVLLRREGAPSGSIAATGSIARNEPTVAQRKTRRRRGEASLDLGQARPNARWTLDFVYDQFTNGQHCRVHNLVDDVTRECLAATRTPRYQDDGWHAI